MKNKHTLIEILVTISMAIITPVMLILMGWVAWHFIAKYW